MQSIEVDFETYKAIVSRRRDESMSESDVVREALGLTEKHDDASKVPPVSAWWHKGVSLPIGLMLEHTFRDGRTAKARIIDGGVEYAGKRYRALSPAGVAAAGYQVDGWAFWNFRDERGNLMPMKAKRQH